MAQLVCAGRTALVLSPAGAIFLLIAPSSSTLAPSLFSNSYGVHFPGLKRLKREA
jgi:hypothetical protein